VFENKNNQELKIIEKEIIDINYELGEARREEIKSDIILKKRVSNFLDSSSKQSVSHTYKKFRERK